MSFSYCLKLLAFLNLIFLSSYEHLSSVLLNTMCLSRFLMFIIFYICYAELKTNYMLIDCDISSKFSPLVVIFVQLYNFVIQNVYNSRYHKLITENSKLEISFSLVFQILLLSCGVIYLVCIFLLELSSHFRYLKFNTNLNLYNKKTTMC